MKMVFGKTIFASMLMFGVSLPTATVTAQRSNTAGQQALPAAVIPRALHMTTSAGAFEITRETVIATDLSNDEFKKLASTLVAKIKTASGYVLRIVKEGGSHKKNVIVLSSGAAADSLGKEGYRLQVEKERIVLWAKEGAGMFYGIQTLFQLFPVNTPGSKTTFNVPAVEIIDKPRYSWRGMMLDVGRYFYPVADVKKFIDYMAMYKMNIFQWHLTDDQGWRIEIKKHPRLVETSAWRGGTLVGHLNDQPRQYDGRRHGGFYTQEQVREIIKYAAERYITVIPEIEMPGHAVAALAAYPGLSCTGGPFEVSRTWGVHEDVFCAGNEQTFTFLQDVLTEVADLFPASIIHIGGDECPKVRWKACGKCQARIRRENLKDEHELQSYFIRRIENFLLTRNKSVIGWDEILEGGLAPNAMVMSWRGTGGGITAARQRHGVVMTPRNPAYLDYYQGDPATEPLTIGGKNLLRDVYAYDPVPAELTKEEAKYILGSQANVWTEYMPDRTRAEYMIMPRMAALAEVVWTPSERKDWNDFTRRMITEYKRYEASGIGHSKSAGNVQYTLATADDGTVTVSLHNDMAEAKIFYTVDGTEPGAGSTAYTSPLMLKAPTTLKAAAFINGKQTGVTTGRSVVPNPASHGEVQFTVSPDRRAVAGNKSLLNNLRGSANFRDGEWLGYYGKEMIVVVDLGTPRDLKTIRASFLHHRESNAVLPATVRYAVSVDGVTYNTTEGQLAPPQHTDTAGSHEFITSVGEKNVRYIRITATPRQIADGKTWLYADEIIIE